MELREFAEAVLFGSTLEEKLQAPGVITDGKRGSALVAPLVPGRPPELRFKSRGEGKGGFPGSDRIQDEKDRGRLLHFFANHELLATELMALVLLRFPEAPPSFRQGVLRTLKDEQEHTRLYLARMRECGVQFGELPVSGYFWRAISGMQSPMDFVAGLSLTFEQANLDFARHFAGDFAAAGDAETAQLLERIYRDEIAHVAHGLKWFRRWKEPGESDWEAFCKQLKFPLSPSRARGGILNMEGRRAAGFDSDFIAQLEVHAQSKGRTPCVFLFNPFCEAYIAQGKSFTPTKQQSQLAHDLANLPQFLCREDDIVLVTERPAVNFLSAVKRAGFALPEFVELRNVAIDPQAKLAQRKIAGLRPWAWGPDSLEILRPLLENVTTGKRSAEQWFHPGIRQIYSKEWSADFLRRLLAQQGEATCLLPASEAGKAVHSIEAAVATIQTIRTGAHHKIVVKEALGLAGHNAIRLWEPTLLEKQRRWMIKALEHGPLVIEPWLERVLDFSVQLEMSDNGLKVCGYTGLVNDLKGQFQANWAAANYARRLPLAVANFFRSQREEPQRIQQLYGEVFELLEKDLRNIGYIGPIGIDAFVYRAGSGEYRLKPVVEINPRYTMGRLTVELMRNVCPGGHGLFRLINLSTVQDEGFRGFIEYAGHLQGKFPLCQEGNPSPKLREGVVLLNDPEKARNSLAIFQVSRLLENLWRPDESPAS